MCKIVTYDKNNDILVIHKGFSKGEKFKGNIDIGDIILDVSTTGKIKGIEIMNATKLFRDFEIGKNALEHISDAQFEVTIKPNSIILAITIKAENIKTEMPATIAVPLATPIYH